MKLGSSLDSVGKTELTGPVTVVIGTGIGTMTSIEESGIVVATALDAEADGELAGYSVGLERAGGDRLVDCDMERLRLGIG